MTDFKDSIKKFNRLIKYMERDALVVIGTEAVNHFKESFDNEGFTDRTLTKWEKIAGNYKVYDTLGSYLYDMEIIHIFNETIKKDTLIFKNLYNQFNLYSWQSYLPNNVNPFSISIGPEDPIFDKQNNRWDLFPLGDYPTESFNVWKNDTIIMKYRLTNIKYWIEDATPYCYKIVKEVAVKQH
ncbi:MAG: hypothetical protein EBU01_04495 [Crocinitomicaceae bacterium]|nr:hypothetical protein [Crocinitomicaceae bacterium]